jgi:hypothetical protein
MLLLEFIIGCLVLSIVIISIGRSRGVYESVNLMQAEWCLRRDNSECCFIFLDENHNLGLCEKDSKKVYRIYYSNFISRVIYDSIVMPNRLVSLCDEHFEQIIKTYNPKYETRLAEVGDVNTRFYKLHHPEDEFPI